MIEHDLISPAGVAIAVRNVWDERNQTTPPDTFAELPESWRHRYQQMAADPGLVTTTYLAALVLVHTLWAGMSTFGELPR